MKRYTGFAKMAPHYFDSERADDPPGQGTASWLLTTSLELAKCAGAQGRAETTELLERILGHLSSPKRTSRAGRRAEEVLPRMVHNHLAALRGLDPFPRPASSLLAALPRRYLEQCYCQRPSKRRHVAKP